MIPEASAELSNWAGNHRYSATAVHHPETLDELRRLASTLPSLRALGTRHTFTAMGDAGQLVALDRLAGAAEIAIDREQMTVTVGPAVTYAQLAEKLEADGLALANMASLPHISVIGAVITGTHGSGDALGNLATSVRALRLVTSTGDVIEIGERDRRFPGAVVNLGAIGIVTHLTVAVEPSYQLWQRVYVGMEWDQLAQNLDAITSAGRSVSVFHRFGERVREVWVKGEAAAPQPASLFGAHPATEPRNPVPGSDPSYATAQLGVLGPWCERLPHFRAGFTPSAGEEIQSEWFVAREDAIAALTALREQLAPRIRPILYVAETRTIAADELWLSPHHQRDSIGLHFTWHREPEAVGKMCAEVERVLGPFSPRPHWGKVFEQGAATIASRYPRLADFDALRGELDPRGAFSNAWLSQKLLPDAPHPTA